MGALEDSLDQPSRQKGRHIIEGGEAGQKIEYTSQPRPPKQDFKHLIDRFE